MTTRTDPPTCNGTPPEGMRDPFVIRRRVDRGTWERAIRDHVPLDPTIGYVAMMVATYTDFSNGANAFPGEARLALATGRSVRTVRNALAWLDEHGFLQLGSRGGRNPHLRYADVYGLALPMPLTIKMGLTEDEGKPQWVERHWIGDRPVPPPRERLSQSGHRQPVTTHRQRVT